MNRHQLSVALILMSGLHAGTALAHAKLMQSYPAAHAVVDAPAAVSVSFNEALEPAFSQLTVLDSQGVRVATEKAGVDEATHKTLSVPVPKLAPGSYTVKWAVVSVDGHRIKGQYTFGVK
ncbi:MAG: copper homeostasis periplasmic binding protein CopC [Fluviicoccus sp.]|uniref:copper homeostasis periplasmic binding protein CopC n=1 Tax=Fluviicoccus sp. TaxID=2003552 RepID=UPI002722D037|nr:copper homeostasis periplasmic binding protein CopC [Fluviicoccus sp.]MDO8328855.1 copper homeostasis periplasmic binding protein CopC [Fluviicoccus sp.]